MIHVSQSDRTPQGMTVHTRGDVADNLIVSPDRFIVIQQWIRIIEQELHQAFFKTSFTLAQQRLTADKSACFVEGHGKTQACLQRCIFVRYVVTPVTISLFDSKRIHCMHAHQADSVCLPRLHQSVINVQRKFCGDMQFPAKFSNVGDPHGTNLRVANFDFPKMSETESLVAQVRATHPIDERTGIGAHHAEHRVG